MSDQFGMPMVDCRPTHEVITELRQQLAVVQAENLRLTAMPFASEAVRAVVYGRKIDELNQQLATANTAFDVVQKDCWNLTEKVIPNLRQQFAERDKQVMLLREKFQELADNFVWNGDDHSYQHWVIEVSQAALAATEPKQ